MLSILLNLSLLNYELTNESLNLEFNEKPISSENYEIYIDNKLEEEIVISTKKINIPIIKDVKRNIILKNQENEIYIPKYDFKTCENLIPKGYINEISLDDDFIELFIPTHENLDFFYLEIDDKKIPIEQSGLFTINHKLPRTDEQISLKFLNHTVDAFCYKSKDPADSEIEDFENFKHIINNCFEIAELPKNTSFSRINLSSTISISNYEINSNPSPNSFIFEKYQVPNNTKITKDPETITKEENSTNETESVKELTETETINENTKETIETNQEEMQTIELSIVSIMPNPKGSDTDNEYINIKNTSKKDLVNFTIQIKDKSETIENYLIEKIESEEILSIFPKKVSLNNSDEIIQIFYNDQLLDEITYSDSIEGELILSSKTQTNEKIIENIETQEINENSQLVNLLITEIYPNPDENETEWIEILNLGDTIETDDLIIKINGNIKKIDNKVIPKNSYTSLDISPLSNSSAVIEIYYHENLIEKMSYENSIKGESYSLINEKYYWIKHPTKNAVNQKPQQLSGEIQEINDEMDQYKINEKIYLSSENLNLGTSVEFMFYEYNGQNYIFEILEINEVVKPQAKSNYIKAISIGTLTLFTLFIKYFNNVS